MSIILLIGRILFSAIFIIKSFDHFSAQGLLYAAQMQVPMPSLLVPLAGIFLLLGGLSILFGCYARVGAWILIIFLIPSTWMMHPFWKFHDFHHAMMNEYCFMKNIALIGACLMIAYFGSGPLSLTRSRKLPPDA